MEQEIVKPPGPRRGKSRPNLDELSLEELTALRDEIENRRQALIRENRSRITKEITNRLRAVGLAPEDLFPALARKVGPGRANPPPRRKVPPKYRGPHGDTWTGQGFTPRWLAALEAEGRDRKEFLITPEPPGEPAAG